LFLSCTLIYIIVCFCLNKHFAREEGYVSTIPLFTLLASIYYVAIPFELNVTGCEGYTTERGFFVEMPFDMQAIVVLMATSAVVSFSAGYKLSGCRIQPESFIFEAKNIIIDRTSFFIAINLMFFLSSVLLLLFFRDELIYSIAGYGGNVAQTYSNSTYSYIKSIFTMSTSVLIFLHLCIKKTIGIGLALTLTLVAIGILTSDKDPILLAALPMLTWLIAKANRKKKYLILSFLVLIGGSVFALVLVPIFSLYRAGINIFSMDLVDHYYFSFTQIDPSGPFISLADSLRDLKPLLYGKTYIDGLTILVPKIVWANRPLDLAEQFARDFLPLWEPGFGVGYSLMTEGLINFGYLGAFVHYFTIGFGWGVGWRMISLCTASSLHMNVLYRTIGFYLLTIVHRGPLSQIVKTLILFMMPLLVTTMLIHFLKSVATDYSANVDLR